MNNILSSTSHRLEILPDEIFLEIFKYLKPIDLHSFIGHNLRINNIIHGSFLPNQFIRLELCYPCEALDLHSYTQLRSLKFDCIFLLEQQFDQVLTVTLPYLEQLSICNVSYSFGKELLLLILDSKHFPSLKFCQFSGKFYYMLDFNKLYQLPNLTIRTLLLGKWNASMLGPLLNFLPNLHRFETSFSESINESLHFNMYHTSIEHLRISLMDVFNDLEKILPYMPNLKQLRVTGKIPEHSISKNFENLSKILCVHTPDLQKFDCELYCHGCNEQADILIIQQFHPLFNLIQCHLGRFLSQCYTTDLTTHTTLKEFAYFNPTRNDTAEYCEEIHRCNSGKYYNDDHNSINSGLDYRTIYKENYLSLLWNRNDNDY
ncbi:unnamed protein product [Rotaria sordida]|uniref:F-box domain-containing protein n=1 Tax=Rotaria sordida TaxID=392033 RepID=A0A814N2L3_9BILA|nr:unnamed protein product [Rotaria sordida]CAF1277752.1 unnamed protein product [Rotaria sordida]